jgi:hypothetical protein
MYLLRALPGCGSDQDQIEIARGTIPQLIAATQKWYDDLEDDIKWKIDWPQDPEWEIPIAIREEGYFCCGPADASYGEFEIIEVR